MSTDDIETAALSPRDGLAQQLRQLEDFVARAEAAGDTLPSEATEMIARLREIVRALDALTSTLASPESSGPEQP